MIELRWKEILSKVEYNGSRPIVKTVLQYRQKVDKTIYAGFPPPNSNANLEWSDWRDVPTIQEIPN